MFVHINKGVVIMQKEQKVGLAMVGLGIIILAIAGLATCVMVVL